MVEFQNSGNILSYQCSTGTKKSSLSSLLSFSKKKVGELHIQEIEVEETPSNYQVDLCLLPWQRPAISGEPSQNLRLSSVWATEQQPLHHLRTCKKCRISVFQKNLLSENIHFNTSIMSNETHVPPAPLSQCP